MEHLDLSSRVDQAVLGKALAQLHMATPSSAPARDGRFGFDCDNTIGGTPQRNTWSTAAGKAGWVQFFTEHRLMAQARMTRDSVIQRYTDTLAARMDSLFEDIDHISPALLHGDLWSGNIYTVDGQPCVIDPACYYGHAEAEWGMSWCAGFTSDMYAAYHAAGMPRAPLFQQRAKLYQLYHFLNHLNLFGDGYRGQCVALLEDLIK
jgi:fructosamine-3-kinase